MDKALKLGYTKGSQNLAPVLDPYECHFGAITIICTFNRAYRIWRNKHLIRKILLVQRSVCVYSFTEKKLGLQTAAYLVCIVVNMTGGANEMLLLVNLICRLISCQVVRLSVDPCIPGAKAARESRTQVSAKYRTVSVHEAQVWGTPGRVGLLTSRTTCATNNSAESFQSRIYIRQLTEAENSQPTNFSSPLTNQEEYIGLHHLQFCGYAA